MFSDTTFLEEPFLSGDTGYFLFVVPCLRLGGTGGGV
jgi:hypothetical protein